MNPEEFEALVWRIFSRYGRPRPDEVQVIVDAFRQALAVAS